MAASDDLDLSALGHPDVRRDPYPLLARLREASPFAYADGEIVVIARYDDCAQVLRDPGVSSDRSASRSAARLPQTSAPFQALSFLGMDPPDHTRLRRLVSTAFTPRAVAALERRVREITDHALAVLPPGGGTVDLMPVVANRLPLQVICHVLGVPDHDGDDVPDWIARLARALDPQATLEPAAVTDARAAADALSAHLESLVAERRARPADDLCTELITAMDVGGTLTRRELASVLTLLLAAGHETTAGLISNGLLALLRRPRQWELLAANPSLTSSAVDEVLRYDPPVQIIGRTVRGAVRIGDLEAEDGTVLKLLLGAANRDPASVEDPDRFDITRPRRPHLAFALGRHHCLGAGLARLEAGVVFESLTRRLRGARLVEETLDYKPNVNLRNPSRLEIEFETYTHRR